jgi:hypothetical protein
MTDLRRYMTLVEQMHSEVTLMEARGRKFVDQDGTTYRVWYNPSNHDLHALLKRFSDGLRGFVDGYEMIVWDAMTAVYRTIEDVIRDHGDWPDQGMVSIIIGSTRDDLGYDSL